MGISLLDGGSLAQLATAISYSRKSEDIGLSVDIDLLSFSMAADNNIRLPIR